MNMTPQGFEYYVDETTSTLYYIGTQQMYEDVVANGWKNLDNGKRSAMMPEPQVGDAVWFRYAIREGDQLVDIRERGFRVEELIVTRANEKGRIVEKYRKYNIRKAPPKN